MSLRLRVKRNVDMHVIECAATTTLAELKQMMLKQYAVPTYKQKRTPACRCVRDASCVRIWSARSHISCVRIFAVLRGFPPKPLVGDDSALLTALGVVSGDSLILTEDADALPPPASSPPPPAASAFTTMSASASALASASASSSAGSSAGVSSEGENRVVVREIAADNSCLFNSIAYAMHSGSKTMATELRELVAGIVLSQPDVRCLSQSGVCRCD